MKLTLKEQRLAQYTELTAFFMTDRQFQEWIDLRWKLIYAYDSGKLNTIYPCMRGEYYIAGKRYKL